MDRQLDLTGFQNLSGLIQHGGINFIHVPKRLISFIIHRIHHFYFGWLTNPKRVIPAFCAEDIISASL
jgi:hypothetical protein